VSDRARRRVRLFHWNLDEARASLEKLENLGFQVDYDRDLGPEILKRVREHPPDAVVIDLSRAPSQGRDVGVALRTSTSTRSVPLVFADGAAEKVARTRQVLPDATYTTWDELGDALKIAISAPLTDPVVPESALAGYSGTPLPKKLGIKQRTHLTMLDPPADARRILGALPDGVTFSGELTGDTDLVIWFVRSLAALHDGIETVARRLGGAHLWIAWPKKTSALAADIGQQQVREAGLANGLVDYKVCAIDRTWSGLKFVRRKK